ncbi:MAG: hypothetical protein CMG25_02445 [Candidatus Marinimicrobia bacterium]|nr:hypothetical protein [Candidatus Neomarinimicrobiota bacterium]|tara:strand:- start:13097 stop:13582 length:486 start_codon:yes stop_codon:yes gene_type:complete
MKPIEQWIDEYGESHQNPINKAIHWICVPLIMLSLLALIGQIPFFTNKLILFHIGSEPITLNWTILFLIFSVIFYLRLSLTLSIGMMLIAFSMLYLISYIRYYDSEVWRLSLIIFIIAWIGQFIGHKIEGKKPSFFEDLQFLLIGPAWLLSFIYNKLGIKL